MAHNDDNEKSVLVSVLAGIGIGVLVGAVAGLLLAPKSGQETRDDLGKAMNDLSDKMTDFSRTVGQKVSAAVDKTRATMTQKLGEVPPESEEVAS
jgi:gas vesicle protein